MMSTSKSINRALEISRNCTIEEIVDYFMSTWSHSSTKERFYIFSQAVYLQEKNKVEQSRGGKLEKERSRRNKKSSASCPENKEAKEFKDKGNHLFRGIKVSDAILAYTEAIKLDPNRAVYYFDRALAFYTILDFSSCLNDLKKALAIDPFYCKACRYLGKCFQFLFLMDDAKVWFSRAKILEPSNKILDQELDETCHLSDKFSNLLNSVKLGNNLCKDNLLASLSEIVTNNSTISNFTEGFSFINKNITYQVYREEVYINIREMITVLGLEGFSHMAREEVKRLARNFTSKYRFKDLLHYFLGMCSYYEDDENKVLENFKVFEKIFFLFIELKYCNQIREIYSLRKEGNKFFDKGQYEEAVQRFLQCFVPLENGFTNPILQSNLYYKIACSMLKLNKEEEELVFLNKAIIEKTDNHEAIAARGEHYLRRKDFTNALEDFKTANKLHPCDTYKELINKTKLKQSSPFSTDEDLLKESSLQQDLAVCKKEKGNKYFNDKLYKEAINAFSEAINLDSSNPVYYSNRAACYIELKDFQKSLQDCERALEFDPSYVKGLYRLSVCHIALGRAEDAMKVLDKALKKKPNDKSLRAEKIKIECLREYILKGDTAYNDRNYTAADQNYSKALLISESCLELRLKRVDCLIHLEIFDEALSEAGLVCSVDCENSELFYRKGLCYFYKQEKARSIEFLEKSLALKSEEQVSTTLKMVKDIFCLKDLGDKAFRENKYEEALAHYQDALKQDSKNKKLIFHFNVQIGIVHMKEHNIEEAINYFTAVINLQKDNIEIYKHRAECYLKLGLLEDALKDFEEINTIAPNKEHQILVCETKAKLKASVRKLTEKELKISLSKIKLKKADEYFTRKNYKDALECYTTALDLDSENYLLYLSRSNCYMTLKNYRAALSDAVEVIKRDGKCLKGYIISGECHTFLGNADEAISAFEQAKVLNASNKKVTKGIQQSLKLGQCLNNAGDAQKIKRFDRAYDMYKCASRIAVACPSILLSVAECLISLQRLPGLVKLIDSVNDTLKESAEYFCMKGLDFYHQDKMSQALKHLEKAVKKGPSNIKCKDYLDRVHMVYDKKQKGNNAFFLLKYDVALKLYKEGLEIETENLIIQSKFHYNIGVVMKKRSLMSEAIESFTKAINLQENYTNALEKRAQCYRKINEIGDAIKDYENLYKLTNSKKHLNLLKDLKKQKQNLAKKDYYKILRVSQQASMDEIRKAYKALAKEYHPDRLCTADKEMGEEKFKEINEAYSILIDPLKRERYDRGETDFRQSEPFNFGFHPFMFNPFARAFFRSRTMDSEFDPFDY